MYVTRAKESIPVRQLIGHAAVPIKAALPDLFLIEGVQENGGISMAPYSVEPNKTYVRPIIRHNIKQQNEVATAVSEVKTVDELIRLGQSAPFGHGEDTVLDDHVRKTVRVLPSKVSVDWNPHLGRAVAQFAREILLLPEAQVHHLGAELHNVLVYREGDFFAPHRDSYKMDGHVGSLSVLVDFDPRDIKPEDVGKNPVEGGTVHFAVGAELRSWDATREQPWAAWIGSVRHAVTKVTQGRRVVAVYNLILRPADIGHEADADFVRGIPIASSTSPSPSFAPPSPFMPAGSTLAKMPVALFGRFIDAAFLTWTEAAALRLVCRALDLHVGGVVGVLARKFVAANKIATEIVKADHGRLIRNIPVVLPLRNIYSSGNDESTIPSHHLWGQDLLLYEAAVMALGKSKIRLIPVSIMLERNEELGEYREKPLTVSVARDFVYAKNSFPIPKQIGVAQPTSLQNLGRIYWRETCNDVDSEIKFHPIAFEPQCMFWGGKRHTIQRWRKDKRSYAVAGDNDDDDDGASDGSENEVLDNPVSDPHNQVKTGDDRYSKKKKNAIPEHEKISHLLDALGQEIHDRAKLDVHSLKKLLEHRNPENQSEAREYRPRKRGRVVEDGDDEDRPSASSDSTRSSLWDEEDDCIIAPDAPPPNRQSHGSSTQQESWRYEHDLRCYDKGMTQSQWRRRQLKIRNDPLQFLVPSGYSGSLWGNNATFRLHFYRHTAMVFVLGGEGNDTGDGGDAEGGFEHAIPINWDEIVGPPIQECVVDALRDVTLARRTKENENEYEEEDEEYY